MFVKTPRTTPQKEELNIRNLDIVYVINSPTMVDGKLDNNGCGMHITGSPPPQILLKLNSHQDMQKWDQRVGRDIEEVIGVLLSSIGESGHVIDTMVAQWII